MKINDIPLGGHFVLEGRTYVKTGPMMARGEGGETRVVPRYMALQTEAQASPREAGTAPPPRQEALAQAWVQFYGECRALVPPHGQARLEAAARRFLAASGLEGETLPRPPFSRSQRDG